MTPRRSRPLSFERYTRIWCGSIFLARVSTNVCTSLELLASVLSSWMKKCVSGVFPSHASVAAILSSSVLGSVGGVGRGAAWGGARDAGEVVAGCGAAVARGRLLSDEAFSGATTGSGDCGALVCKVVTARKAATAAAKTANMIRSRRGREGVSWASRMAAFACR